MVRKLSRGDFLKIAALSLLSVAFKRWPGAPRPQELGAPVGRGRVTIARIYRYAEPDFDSEPVGEIRRDHLPYLYEEVQGPNGARANPLWYRLAEGFAHSAYLQRVENARFYEPLSWIPENGRLGEISVPYTQSYRRTLTYGWTPLYRLYYQSVYWITGIEEGPDGRIWYRLTDDLLHVHYYVHAEHVRPVEREELKPIHPEVPQGEKRVEVSLSKQVLTAYEGDRVVLTTKISSGIPSDHPPNGIPTATPTGNFRIEIKLPSRHMGDGNLTSDLSAYELPGVPWVSFITMTGVALHGTYWHNNFGRRMSHGCVNMPNQEAKWVYRWSHPTAEPEDWDRKGRGTRVTVE